MDFDPNQIRALAADWLRWHFAAGVDSFVDDQPHDRFAEADVEKVSRSALHNSTASKRPNATGQSATKQIEQGREDFGAKPNRTNAEKSIRTRSQTLAAAPSAQADALVEMARQLAQSAHDINALSQSMSNFEGCALRTTAKSHIFSGGNPTAALMLIGDAPEADDDRSGAAFSGPAGVLLDSMLKSIGLDRDQVALGMAIPWRPPGNRPPTPHEIALCEPFLRRHLELVAPKLVLSFGTLAAQILAGTSGTLLKQRGQVSDIMIADKRVQLLVTLPPAHLLRYPIQKRFAWQDLKRARDILTTT